MKDDVKTTVRKRYAKIAREKASCCGTASSCCCTPDAPETISKSIGYTDQEMQSVPEGANLGLGCGNPVALASLREGETVLDLGSGAGFDCFLAAKNVGASGKVIGVDMTPEMIEKAKENADKGGIDNVEFRLGEIESLPVTDNSVDVVISNCVINLSPDKKQVFKETYRVLKQGGRLMVSDIVLLKDLPEAVKASADAYVGCLGGAVMKDEYLASMTEAGFSEVTIVEESVFPMQYMLSNDAAMEIVDDGLPLNELQDFQSAVVSIKVEAKK